MRLRSSTFALIGASLLVTARVEPFDLIDGEGRNISQKIFTTTNSKELVFNYSRPKAFTPPSSVKVTLKSGNGSQILSLVISPAPPNPQFFTIDETSATTLGETPPNDGDPRAVGEKSVIAGTITIPKAAELADRIYGGADPGQVPAAILVLDVARGSTSEPSREVKFALLNPKLGDSPDTTNQIKSRLFGGVETVYVTTDPGGSLATVTTEVTPSATSTASATGAPSDNSLAKGAIAGIAIGAALAALLLGTFLVWFFLRRRRQNKAGKAGLGYNGGPVRSGDLVAEKEANAIVAESPRSPYSEDGPRRDSTLVGGTSETAADYQPYSDNPSATANAPPPTIAAPVARAGSANSRSTADRSSAAFQSASAPAPPPAIGEEGLPPRADTGMSGRYAHLIEDNMTAEEIARLEEEERQLDVAIEQARGVTTK